MQGVLEKGIYCTWWRLALAVIARAIAWFSLKYSIKMQSQICWLISQVNFLKSICNYNILLYITLSFKFLLASQLFYWIFSFASFVGMYCLNFWQASEVSREMQIAMLSQILCKIIKYRQRSGCCYEKTNIKCYENNCIQYNIIYKDKRKLS